MNKNMANLLWGTIYILKVLLLYFMKVYSGEIYLGEEEATDKEVCCMTMMDNSEKARGCYHVITYHVIRSGSKAETSIFI